MYNNDNEIYSAPQHMARTYIPNSLLFVQAGKVNCDNEKSLCKRSGVSIGKSARLFIYSYATTEKGSLHEYSGEHDAKSLKTFFSRTPAKILQTGRYC